MKKYFQLATTICLALTSFHLAAAPKPSAEDILKKADEVRNPSESFELKVRIENSDRSDAVFSVKIKGGDKTFVRTLAPARDVGRNMLMIGDDMWAYVPNLKRSVRVALQQKLTGEAANGDLSRMRWSGDYNPTIEKQTEKEWIMMLEAKRKGLTYDKIRLWIEMGNFHPQKAEYLSMSSSVLKRVKFDEYKMLEGAVRPSVLIIEDAVEKTKSSRLIIESMNAASIPDSVFSQDRLDE